MVFRSILQLSKSTIDIQHSNRIMTIGSCFSENIGKKLEENKFSILINPFGTVFNPLSIALQLERLIEDKEFLETDLILQQELWHTWEHSRQFLGTDKKSFLDTIQTHLKKTATFLQHTHILIITFGTAWAYFLKENDTIVANCHKHPSSEFHKKLLSTEELLKRYTTVFQHLKRINPKLNIILTVSPVRHLREGLVQDRWSKSRLIDLAHILEENMENVTYFPAYELFTDDLRDYRFCETDLTHLNSMAIEYIWESFQQTYFSTSTQALIHEINDVRSAILHRVQHHQTLAYQKFVHQQLQRIHTLEKKYSFLNWSEEIAYWEESIK